MGLFSLLFGARLNVACQKCGKKYKIGNDAVVITRDDWRNYARRTLVISDAEDRKQEDLVSGIESSKPEVRKSILAEARERAKHIRKALSHGQKRTWRCHACKNVNSYRVRSRLTRTHKKKMSFWKKLFGGSISGITPELISDAKANWVTADVILASVAKKVGYSTPPSSGSYEGKAIKLACCVSNLMKKHSNLSESSAKELMICVLEDWHEVDKTTASRLRRE
jgi:hypothetical protein